jgi:hypothetical protein
LPVVVVVGEEPVCPVELVDPVESVPPVGVVGTVAEAHVSVTLTTGTLTGSDSDDSGVPGGTLRTKLRCPPPTVVTVTVHMSALATGTAAIAEQVSAAAIVVRAARRSLRLLVTVLDLLPAYTRSGRGGGAGRTLSTAPDLCNAEPSR